MSTCIICQTLLSGRKKLFCSRKCKNVNSNKTNQTYIKQQERGLNRKLECVKQKGGKCSSCGYKKNLSALEFHHLDSDEKEGQLDLRSMSNHSLAWILKELEKCILLCANCHRETHNPQLNLPF